MKKIFILTGEPSGDKLASEVISKLKNNNPNIEYLSVGGSNLKNLGIQSIFDLKDITYLGFTSVLLNILKIRKKINTTVEEIIKFNPDILFSVDSPDFTMRVAEKVKIINPKIKTIHYVAPQVWVWRESRVKKIKNFIDHILLLFDFEKKYFDKENVKSTFVGHPLIENQKKIKTNLDNFLTDNKKIISIFPGSRKSETTVLLPILLDFINLMNKKGSAQIPSIIIYKLNFINFMIFKFLVNVKFANIINIINNKEVIPELLQSECNANEIFKSVNYLLKKPELIRKQLEECNKTLEGIRSKSSSSTEASLILQNYLVS